MIVPAPVHQRASIAGIALVVLANAVALGGVAYNRSGEPEATLALTERELRLPHDWGRNRDNSGLSLTLDWRAIGPDPSDARRYGEPYTTFGGPFLSINRTPAWLDSAKLASLDFEMDHPVNTADGRAHYRRQVPKQVLLVLELNGPAYQVARARMQQWAAREDSLFSSNPSAPEFIRRAEFARIELQHEERGGSRLFLVDAGLDRAALRAGYPDRTRYAIVKGAVQPQVVGPDSIATLEGRIMDLAIPSINVPFRFRHELESIRSLPDSRGSSTTTPFSASVAFGRRLEPWITSVARQP